MLWNSRGLSGCFLACVVLSLAPPAHGAGSAKTVQVAPVRKMDAAHRDWRKALLKLRPGQGCYTAKYPKAEWRKTACKPMPDIPFSPASNTVGGGVDYSGQPSGHTTWAGGMFAPQGVTSESATYHGVNTANAYSVQINTNTFTTPACNDRSGCKGWEQFIYASMQGGAFIQYWMINYGSGCPAGWKQSGNSCVRNGTLTSVGSVPVTALGSVALHGYVSGSLNYVYIDTGENAALQSSSDYLSLASGWTTTEFNLFGPGGSGGTATFNSGASLWVFLALDNGSSKAPSCISKGYTAETSNLTLSTNLLQLPGGQDDPSIAFWESYPAAPPGKCFAMAAD